MMENQQTLEPIQEGNSVETARRMWKEGDPLAALEILGTVAPANEQEASFLAGEIHYSLQNWGAALNCFNACLRLDPELQPALSYVSMIRNILGFYHTDHFNP